MATPTMQPGAPQKKGMGPLGWILIGCGGLILLGALVFGIGGYFVYRKAKDVGLDTESLKSHPELAAIKLAVAANPDAEIVKLDENAGKVTIRQKSTGKEVTLNFEDIKKGRISFESSEGKVSVETQGNGESGSVKVTTPEGTANWGAGGKAPAWFPQYPGSTIQGTYEQQASTGTNGGFGFQTSGTPEEVAAFYKGEFERAGMKLTTSSQTVPGSGSLQIVAGVTADGSRKVNVIISQVDGTTRATVTYETK